MKGNDIPSLACLGVCTDGDADGFDYWIAAGSTKPIPSDLEELIFAPATYAVFPALGRSLLPCKLFGDECSPNGFPRADMFPKGLR
jgi:hypothetical protein